MPPANRNLNQLISDDVGKGDIAHAMVLQNLLLDYMDVVWRYGLLPSFAVVMRELGYAPHVWRRPRQTFDEKITRRFIAEGRPKLEAIQRAIN